MPTVPVPTGHRLGGGLLSDPESLDENGHLASESATTCVLLDMPLDCMMEILLYLGPEELLRLARLCKPLRSFLMTKSSRSIWKQGFLNLEGPVLPPCPPGLSEVQYAHLAFSNYCQECLRITYLPTDWDLRVRYCSMCEVMNTTEFDSDNPQRLPCHPTVDIQKLLAIRPPTFRPAFLNTDLIAVTAVYEQLDAQERKAYRNSRNRILIDARIHARECRAWDAQRAKLARAAAKARRNQTVRDNLCALGWSAEVDKLHDSELDHCFEFGNYEPLTEAAWLKIKPRLQYKMKDIREDQARHLAQKAIAQQYKAMSPEARDNLHKQQLTICDGRMTNPVAYQQLMNETGGLFAEDLY